MGVLSLRRLALPAAVILLNIITSGAVQAAGKPGLKLFVAEVEFEDAAFELENAIVDRGLKIDYRGHIGKMMERTAADFGGDRSDYKDAQFITFCSVPLTRAMIKADASNIGFCPYIVFLYELRSEPGKTYVGYRRPVASGTPDSVKAVQAVDDLLSKIVQQATQ